MNCSFLLSLLFFFVVIRKIFKRTSLAMEHLTWLQNPVTRNSPTLTSNDTHYFLLKNRNSFSEENYDTKCIKSEVDRIRLEKIFYDVSNYSLIWLITLLSIIWWHYKKQSKNEFFVCLFTFDDIKGVSRKRNSHLIRGVFMHL